MPFLAGGRPPIPDMVGEMLVIFVSMRGDISAHGQGTSVLLQHTLGRLGFIGQMLGGQMLAQAPSRATHLLALPALVAFDA